MFFCVKFVDDVVVQPSPLDVAAAGLRRPVNQRRRPLPVEI